MWGFGPHSVNMLDEALSGADHHRPTEGDIKMPPKNNRKTITGSGARGRGRAGCETRKKVLLMLEPRDFILQSQSLRILHVFRWFTQLLR